MERKHPLTPNEAKSLEQYLKTRLLSPLSVVTVVNQKITDTTLSLITAWHRENNIIMPCKDTIRIFSTGGKSLWVDIGFLLEIN